MWACGLVRGLKRMENGKHETGNGKPAIVDFRTQFSFPVSCLRSPVSHFLWHRRENPYFTKSSQNSFSLPQTLTPSSPGLRGAAVLFEIAHGATRGAR